MVRVSLLSALAAIVLLSVVRIGAAQERIGWTADMRAAQKSAARDGKLILLHFYSDDCRPCKTLDRNVFSQPDVAASVAKNYVPVKVHVDSMPQLAQHYGVDAWPTDVIVTAAGQQVFRTISPQSSAQYQTMLDQVAFQAGVGAGRLAGGNLLEARPDRRGDVSLTAATAPAGPTVEGATRTLPTTSPPAPRYDDPAARTPAASELHVQPQRTQNRPYGEGYPPPNGAATDEAGPYVGGTRYSPPGDRWAGPTGNQHAPTTAPKSIYADPADPPAATAPTGQSQPQQAITNPAIPEPTRSIYDPAPAAQRPAQSSPQFVPQQGYQPPAQPSQDPRAQRPHQPAVTPPAAQPAPATQQASAQFRSRQFVEVSQAPPFALELFCPVTLLESKKWHKGNVRFGAVHRNRTYLFASEDAQRRFLADPERYAPVLSGCDPVLFAETNQWIDGNPSIGLLIGGKTFFFVSAESRSRFLLSPQPYTARAYEGMAATRTR
jgi:YHS domain-containing protein/thiol-disulfide isomerase/thioredoxin